MTWKEGTILVISKGPYGHGPDVTLAIGHAGEGTGEECGRTLPCSSGSVHPLPDVEHVEEAASECEDGVVADGVHEVNV